MERNMRDGRDKNSIIGQCLKTDELGLGRSQTLPSSSSVVSVPGPPTCNDIHKGPTFFPLRKPSQLGNNIQTSKVHNLWSFLQELDKAPAVFQDPDIVLIRVESMIKSTTDIRTTCSVNNVDCIMLRKIWQELNYCIDLYACDQSFTHRTLVNYVNEI
ncbi:hypothetical protein TNCV_3375291 [Trichonephila clavipes]|nr:hypothetical protein TNCV_3375291 [Trichonephila clavipes]